MARDESKAQHDPENKSPGSSKRDGTTQHGAALAPRRGKSGYGIESIRPHLRAQLEQRKLWRKEFPPQPDDEED